jgi:hypothetical protein
MIREGASPEMLSTMLAEISAPGECRIQDGKHDGADFPDVRPVLSDRGLQWCCTYGHCSKPLLGLA